VYASVEFQQLVGSGGSSWLLPMSRDSSVVAEQGLEPFGSQIRYLEPSLFQLNQTGIGYRS